MFKIAIFDLDGVVINSLELQKRAFAACLSQYNINDASLFKKFLLFSGDSLKNIFIQLGLPVGMVEIYRDFSKKNIEMIKLVDGITELLCKLNACNIVCTLCTGKDRERTLQILDKFRIKPFFRTVVCSDDVIYPKPHAESIITILKSFHFNAKCIMIGDAPNDIFCAKNAGIASIAVNWGEHENSILDNCHPNYCVTTIHELEICLLNYFSAKTIESNREPIAENTI